MHNLNLTFNNVMDNEPTIQGVNPKSAKESNFRIAFKTHARMLLLRKDLHCAQFGNKSTNHVAGSTRSASPNQKLVKLIR